MPSYSWIGIAFVGAGLCAQAQWLNQPTPGAPRTPDGKVNMTGPVGRLNGKPDLSGIWQAKGRPRGPGLYGLGESENTGVFRQRAGRFQARRGAADAGGRGNYEAARGVGRD